MTKEKTQNWILEKLRANSLSQTKLSSYTEIHENTISRYCKGECLPGLANFFRICVTIAKIEGRPVDLVILEALKTIIGEEL